MTEVVSGSGPAPVVIDRVDRLGGHGGGGGHGDAGVRLRLSGRWIGRPRSPMDEPLLVVQLHGHRHRFPPVSSAGAGGSLAPASDRWEATFALPDWAEPRQEGQAALWVADAVVPVPLAGSAGARPGGLPAAGSPPVGSAPPALPAPLRPPGPPPLGEAAPWPPEPPVTPAPILGFDLAGDAGRGGPLADILFKESVSALHAELEQRTAEAARLRGALADAQSELEARGRRQSALESVHAELRAELQKLAEATVAQRREQERRLAEMRKQLADAEGRAGAAAAERDEARTALDGERRRAHDELEAERARVREELEAERGRVREEVEAERARAAQAAADAAAAREAHAVDAAAAREQLEALAAARQHSAAELSALREHLAAVTVARDAASSEAVSLRAELERLGSELAIAREQFGARGGDLAEAERLLAEARALSDELRAETSH